MKNSAFIKAFALSTLLSVLLAGFVHAHSHNRLRTGSVRDRIAPSVPQNLTGYAISTSQINLFWSASNDNKGVAGYRVYRNGVRIAKIGSTSFSSARLLPLTTYRFSVAAFDKAGNTSARSEVIQVRTRSAIVTEPVVISDTTAPVISSFTVPSSSNSLSISGIALKATDDMGVTGYSLSLSPTAPAAGGAGWAASAPTSYTFPAAGANRLYAFAKDAAGNVSLGKSAVVTITLPDTQAPSPPAGVSGVPVSSAQIDLSWVASNDNVGVAGYRVHRNGVIVGSSSGNQYSDAGLMAATTYNYTLSAFDAAGNVSSQSAPIAIVTLSKSTPVLLKLSPVADTLIGGDQAHSMSTTLNVYTWPDYMIANAILLKFDLSNIPASAIIDSAVLQLYQVEADGSANAYNVSVHRLLDKIVNFALATGFTYDGVNPWSPSTCCYNNTPLAQSNISPAYSTLAVDRALGWKSFNLDQLVRDWVRTPPSNLGVLLNSDATQIRDRYRYFASMENANSSRHPTLLVTYRLPSSGPDIQAPSVPSGLAGYSLSTFQANLSWSSSTDNVGVVGYQISRNGIQLGTSTTTHYSDSGLTPATTYNYTVAAYDAAGNLSNQSSAVSVTTLGTSATGSIKLSPLADSFLGGEEVHVVSPTLNTYTWPDYMIANAIVMKFDLSSIPAGAVIDSATLQLYQVNADAAAAPYNIPVHRIIGKTVNFARANSSTYDGLNKWISELAQGDISSAYTSLAVDRNLGIKSFNVKQLIQDWISDPASNLGLLLNSDPTQPRDRYRYFASMESSPSSRRPSLLVNYHFQNTGPDTVVPSVPTGAQGSAVSTIQVNLSWEASTDNMGVAGYRVFRNGVPVGTSTTTSFSDSGLTAATSYQYSIAAFDVAGNVSSQSELVLITTLSP
ncbi:MAG: hypothetical protein A2X97_01175 [Bdellovibrionales bacterium GWA1_52_35]|nr:MAG: hypothetical protein A2X97_01175 [Bdellovibrionales bacterium GWA1_52_35]